MKTPEEYTGQDLITAEGAKEYIIMEKKSHSTDAGNSDDEENIETINFKEAIKNGISTGEYKLVFKTYYNNTILQSIKKTFIVVP